jgi:LPXTG-site transpeptidase (sortase) family protein
MASFLLRFPPNFRSRISTPLTMLLMISLTLGTLAGIRAASAAAVSNNYYVAKTGHTFSDPFLTRWAQLDGRTTLGLPVTEPTVESKYLTQYFEFGALTGGKKTKTATKIKVVDVGSELLAVRHDPMHLVTGRRVGGERETVGFTKRGEPANAKVEFDAKTGHQISSQILSFYKNVGGEETLGRPLSDVYDSAGSRVQWFELGRLEVPAGSDNVKFGAAGFELAIARGLDVSKVKSRGLPDFDPVRFKRFFGDGTVPEAVGPFDPVEIKIPAINVDANVEQVAIVDGVMGIPEDPWAVGWYPTLSLPGDFTNVVMAGHKDWWNIGPTVFWDLNQLGPDEMIYLIGEDATGATYRITESWAVDANVNAADIVSDHGAEMLTLITCDGAFDGQHYLQRWIVRAMRV